MVNSDNFQLFIEQLWRAPELQSTTYFSLSNSSYNHCVGSQKGDIYSFAIIIQEIFYRKGVFYLTNEEKEYYFKVNREDDYDNLPNYNITTSYKEIFQKVKIGLRPSLESDVCSKEIIDLLRRCWSENIHERPDFTTIRDIMRKIIKYLILFHSNTRQCYL